MLVDYWGSSGKEHGQSMDERPTSTGLLNILRIINVCDVGKGRAEHHVTITGNQPSSKSRIGSRKRKQGRQ